MKNFFEQQTAIKQFLEDNYIEYLNEYGIQKPEITDDFIDLDKYKNNFSLFVDFSKINFNVVDDCGETEKLQMSLFLVWRNDTPLKLREKLLNSSSALYKMIQQKNDFSIAYNTTINELNFYNYAEGNKQIVISEFSLTLDIE